MNSSPAEVWQPKKPCWSAVPSLAGILWINGGITYYEAPRGTEARFGRYILSGGGDGEGRKPHTWKRRWSVNSILLSPIKLSGFVRVPKGFIFSDVLQQASKVHQRFYSLCKFTVAGAAKFLVFKWDPITSNNVIVSHYIGNSSSFSCLFLSKSSFNLIVIWIFIFRNQGVSQRKHSIKASITVVIRYWK